MLLFYPLTVITVFPEAELENALWNSTVWFWLSAGQCTSLMLCTALKGIHIKVVSFLLLQTIELLKDNNAPWEASENAFLNSYKSDKIATFSVFGGRITSRETVGNGLVRYQTQSASDQKRFHFYLLQFQNK